MPNANQPKLTLLQALAFSWRHWTRYPLVVFVAIFISITTPIVADVGGSFFFGRIVGTISNMSNGERRLHDVWPYLILITSGWCYYWYGVQFRNFIRSWMDVLTIRQVCFNAFVHVQKMSVEWHSNTLFGSTVRAISRGMWGFDEFGNIFFNNFIPIISVTIAALTMLLLTHPLFGLIMGGFAGVYVVVSFIVAINYLAPQQQKATRRESRISGVISDALASNATVKSFAAEEKEEKTLWATITDWSLTVRTAWYRDVSLGVGQMTIMIVFRVVYFATGLIFWQKGNLSTGDFVFLSALQYDVFSYLRDIGMHIRSTQKAVSDMEESVLLLRSPIEPADAPDATPLDAANGNIDLHDVTFAYAGQAQALYQNLSLNLKPGESVALVGRSGSGKSTFVKLLLRFYDVTAGSIAIKGKDIRHVTRESLRRSIALVPQEPVLFHRSIGENIAYARPEATKDQIEEAAHLAHAHEFIQRLPKGYDTLVGERGVKLSGGERQRVAIARAILADSPILILDEATSSLDTESEQYIQEALEWLMKHRTTIIIAHRLSTILKADRVLVFDHGRVVEDGNHISLLAKADGVYRRMYEMQSGGFLAEEETPV